MSLSVKNTYSFSTEDKLNGAAEYSRVFEGAKHSSDDLFTVLAKKSAVSQARLGLAIAKKSVKKAVKRNVIKRVVRESFRHQKQTLNHYDFVVMCKKKAARVDKKALSTSIQGLFGRLALDE